MLPNVSGLRLDNRRCVQCMAPVQLESREQQLANHMASFVYRPTLEDQIKATDCSICMEPMGTNSSDAPARPEAARSTPFYVDYCGRGHYFHKWCARTLLLNTETSACPDCRAEPDDNARIVIAESYPMPGAGAPAAAAAAAAAAVPDPEEMDADDAASYENQYDAGISVRRRDIATREDGTYAGIPAPDSDAWNNQVREAWERWARAQYPDNPTPQPVSPVDLNDGYTAGARRMRSVVAYAVDALYNSTQGVLTSDPGRDDYDESVADLAAQLDSLLLTRLHADAATLMREYGRIYFLATGRMHLLRERSQVRSMVANMLSCFELFMGTAGNTALKEAIVRFISALMIDDALDPESPHLLGFSRLHTFDSDMESFWSALLAFENERNTPDSVEFGDLTQHATDLLLVHIPRPLLQRLQRQAQEQQAEEQERQAWEQEQAEERPNPRDRSTVRWRFWLKGPVMTHELEQLKERMKANFIGAMRYDVPEFESIVPPGSDMFEGLSIISEYDDMTPPGTSSWDMWMGTYHFEFALNLPTHVANALLDVVSARFARGDTWPTLVEDWFRYGPIHWQRGRDEPRILIYRPFSAPEPALTREQFDAWPHWRYIQREPRFRAIGEDRR